MPYPADGLNLFFMAIYGGYGYDSACGAYLGMASGLPQAGNPPYTASDFLAFYPQFFGPAVTVPCAVTQGSPVITGGQGAAGQLVAGPFPGGTVIASVDANAGTITASNAATASATSIQVYTQPTVPLAVVQAYLNLAYAALMSSRWREMWVIAMGWYIAHFLTLYLQAAADPNSAPGQIAAQGLEQGIAVSQSAGAVSYTQENLSGLESWGAWAKTSFGTQLVSQAQVIGAGMIYIR